MGSFAIGLALIAVLTLVLIAFCAFSPRRRPVLLAAGALLAGGVVLLFAGLAGCRGGTQRQKQGGAPQQPPDATVALYGELFTPEEAAAVEAVAHARQPRSRLPVTLGDLVPLPYRPSPLRHRRALHLGQRKLLLAEVAFLAAHARKGDVVVYAGAAPGGHIPLLASLFHKLGVRFVLYDPRRFGLPKGRKEALSRIETSREFFTDEIARSYAGRDDLLFISDIRTGLPGQPELEEKVLADMRAQERWVGLMGPRAALLKYRPPYEHSDRFEYLAGTVALQPWAPHASSESRLTVERPFKSGAIDTRGYEDRMYYLNTVLREWAFYEHGIPVDLVAGLDHCFDCALEAHIWRAYLRSGGRQESPEAVADLFNLTSKALSRALDRPPHGAHPDEFRADTPDTPGSKSEQSDGASSVSQQSRDI